MSVSFEQSVAKLEQAPLIRIGPKEYVGGFKLGKATVRGAGVMVELIHPHGALAGYICASLIGTFDITETHISKAKL